MKYKVFLEIASNCAAILTAVVATFAYMRFIGAQWLRRRVLERHLREEKVMGLDEGRRTVIHLMANLSMTETEVLHAGFQSCKVKSAPGMDDQGHAARIYFEYDGDDLPAPRKM